MESRDAVSAEARQVVLDRVVDLQAIRREAVSALAAGRHVPGASILASGNDLMSFMLARSKSWRHVLSTRATGSAEGLRRSLPNNRRLLADGLQMSSVFDLGGTEPAARTMLAGEDAGTYYLSYAPVDMRIVDGRDVYVHGLLSADHASILCLSSPAALTAARAYWHAVKAVAVPCEPESLLFTALTRRQLDILELLRAEVPDARIAEILGVSVRTVHSEVAAVVRILGVHSRFAIGFAYARLRCAPSSA